MRYLNDSSRDMGGNRVAFLADASSARPIVRNGWEHGAGFATEATPVPNAASLGPWTRGVIVATAVWSLCEMPLEIWLSGSARDVAACIVAKLLWAVLVCFVLLGSRIARVAYGFLCTIGFMALAFALPSEYRVFPLGCLMLAVECVLKATAFVCLVSTGVYPDEE